MVGLGSGVRVLVRGWVRVQVRVRIFGLGVGVRGGSEVGLRVRGRSRLC